jgi:hypothetical protein
VVPAPAPCVAIPVRHCHASDGLRGTEFIEASSSSTETEAGAGGLGGKKTTGPGYEGCCDCAARFSEIAGLEASDSLLGEGSGFGFAGVKFLILFLRIRRPPRFEPPRMHSRFSRTQRWQGGFPGLPLLSLFLIRVSA